MTDIRLLRGWLDGREAALARRQDELAATIGAAPAVDALGRSGKTSRRHAERITARAHALEASPSLSAALESGGVSADHADASAAVTGSVEDSVRDRILGLGDEVAAAASQRTSEQFRRHLRDLARNLSDDDGVERSEQQRDEARLNSPSTTRPAWARSEASCTSPMSREETRWTGHRKRNANRVGVGSFTFV